MNGDIEIVVFNDKSWVRFSEYEKLEKEDNELIHFLQEQILKLEEENKQLKAQNLKMRGCINCKHLIEYNENTDDYFTCELEKCDNLENWELAEV